MEGGHVYRACALRCICKSVQAGACLPGQAVHMTRAFIEKYTGKVPCMIPCTIYDIMHHIPCTIYDTMYE